MDNEEAIERLAISFRKAIDLAKNDGQFDSDFSFCNFPRACCGDTCCLLGQYLLDNGIKTWYVCGMKGRQSHAWLSMENPTEKESLIIDITGDQFSQDPVYLHYRKTIYVGEVDDFHRLFEINDIRPSVKIEELGGIVDKRLRNLYQKIMLYG